MNTSLSGLAAKVLRLAEPGREDPIRLGLAKSMVQTAVSQTPINAATVRYGMQAVWLATQDYEATVELADHVGELLAALRLDAMLEELDLLGDYVFDRAVDSYVRQLVSDGAIAVTLEFSESRGRDCVVVRPADLDLIRNPTSLTLSRNGNYLFHGNRA